MLKALAQIGLAGPLTLYYGHQTDNRIVRYGMYALGAGMIAGGIAALYLETRKPKVQQIGEIRTITMPQGVDMGSVIR